MNFELKNLKTRAYIADNVDSISGLLQNCRFADCLFAGDHNSYSAAHLVPVKIGRRGLECGRKKETRIWMQIIFIARNSIYGYILKKTTKKRRAMRLGRIFEIFFHFVEKFFKLFQTDSKIFRSKKIFFWWTFAWIIFKFCFGAGCGSLLM